MKKSFKTWLIFLLTLVVILVICGTLLFLILVNLTGLLNGDVNHCSGILYTS